MPSIKKPTIGFTCSHEGYFPCVPADKSSICSDELNANSKDVLLLSSECDKSLELNSHEGEGNVDCIFGV